MSTCDRSIGLGVGAWEPVLSLPTGSRAPAEPFTFAVITDPHCVETPASVRHGRGLEHTGDGLERFRRCLRAVRDLAGTPSEFILLLGDIGLERAEEALVEAPCPVHAVAGNHEWGDRRAQLRALFPGDFGTGDGVCDYYAFTHRNVSFLGLCNAGTGNEHVGQLASEEIWPPWQLSWLERQMASVDGLKVLFAHCPPEPQGFDRSGFLARRAKHYIPYMGENDSRVVRRLLRDHGPAIALFGHTHRISSRETEGGSLLQIVRSACWNHDREPIGFLQVRITPADVAFREVITGRYR